MDFTLETLEGYLLSESFSDEIWAIVENWDVFKKKTIGEQLVRDADSISANIGEGYGRYYYNESKQFYFYSRGSILETKSWLSKLMRRKIVDEKLCADLMMQTEAILRKLNSYIKFVATSQKRSLSKRRADK